MKNILIYLFSLAILFLMQVSFASPDSMKDIKQGSYGSLFMWGIGTNGLGKLSAKDYISAMEKGLWR